MNPINNRQLTSDIIAAAIAVHRDLGPGFLESIYEEALCVESLEQLPPYVARGLFYLLLAFVVVGFLYAALAPIDVIREAPAVCRFA